MPSPQDREWRQVVVALDLEQARLDQYQADMQARLDAYASDSATRTAEMIQAHQERVRQFEDDQRAWFKSLYDGEPAPTNVGQGQLGASATGWSSPAGPGGPGPGQPPNPHPVELEEAERLHDLTLAEYAAERQRHIRPNQGLF
jgi:hypothetical protein